VKRITKKKGRPLKRKSSKRKRSKPLPEPSPKYKRAVRRVQPNGMMRQLSTSPVTRAEHRERILKELARGLSPTYAAEVCGLARSTAYSWREQDAEFRQAWDEAVAEGLDRLEDEAHRRGVFGVKTPVFQGGRRVGYIQMYSDTLLVQSMRARLPMKYRDNAPPAPTNVNIKMTLEQARAKLKELGLPMLEIEGDYEVVKDVGDK
jgi:hypothetical protein